QMQKMWAERGLFIFFLPPYSPHLNIIERLWKEIKARWLRPEDYLNEQQLFYSTNLLLAAIGKNLKINFSKQQN
ncbi:transposase, partial [Mucilaginibacter arboris]|uniref:transposase n=1 Tax=Mucilaginibacter arboris TaxID=2682090 RepID=UPI001E4AC30A